jgi:hypothetical protein
MRLVGADFESTIRGTRAIKAGLGVGPSETVGSSNSAAGSENGRTHWAARDWRGDGRDGPRGWFLMLRADY